MRLNFGWQAMKKQTIQKHLVENFADFWPQYLLFEIYRWRKITEISGSPADAMILHVVAWNYFLSTTLDQKIESKDFESVLKAWNVGFDDSSDKNSPLKKRLTVSGIAHQTSIAFETVRRRVSKLEERGLITNSRERGILLRPDTDFNKKIVEDLHPMEQKSMINLLHRFCSYMGEEPK